MSPVEPFLRELDRLWDGEDRVTLRVIGSVALMLQAPFVRVTKDYDVLDVVDVVISKLKRFSVSDQGDIEEMANLGVVDPVVVLERFKIALDANSMSAVADDYPKIVENFHAVQRDWLYVDESDIDLPRWS